MQTFETATPISAILDVPAGRIRFIAADRPDTTVEVLPADPSRKRDVKAAEETTIAYADGTLRIEAPSGRQLLGPSGSVEVTVQLPAGSRLESTTASADVRGVGRLGDVRCTNQHGPIKLDEAATAHLETQAGDITVGLLTGAAEISTSKGDLRVNEAVRGTVVLRTQAGSISIGAAATSSATLDANTTLGRIQNALRNADGADAQLAIQASTAYGDISARTL